MIDELIHTKRILMAAVLTLALAGPQAGADAQPAANAGPSSHKDFAPAAFRTDEWALSSQIGFPKGNEDLRVAVPCFVTVSRQGRLSRTLCVSLKERLLKFDRNVILAASRSKMNPARVNGNPTAVRVHFTAIFERQGGQEKIYTIPHQFLNAEEFGTAYQEPQLILESIKSVPPTCRGKNLIVRVWVDATGVPSNPTYHRGDPSSQACLDTAKDRLLNWRFIPGFVNGQPTAMNYLLYLNWRLDRVLSDRLV